MNRLNYLLMALALGTATLPVMAEEHLHSLDLNIQRLSFAVSDSSLTT